LVAGGYGRLAGECVKVKDEQIKDLSGVEVLDLTVNA